jgi:hypothetical protein
MRTFLILIVAVVMTLAARDGAGAQSFTSPRFSNATGSPVTAWLTLGADSMGKVEDAKLLDISTGQNVPVSGSGLQASFTLQANQAVSWNSFNGALATGAVTFRAPPQSCPISGDPCGLTKGEFAINVGNEALDVSSVDGINAIMAMDLSGGGADAMAVRLIYLSPSVVKRRRIMESYQSLSANRGGVCRILSYGWWREGFANYRIKTLESMGCLLPDSTLHNIGHNKVSGPCSSLRG